MSWVEEMTVISEAERRELRVQIIHTAAMMMDVGTEIVDDELTERIVKFARRFEQYVVDGL